MTERRLILVNHLLEPPNRVTGITRFLFALLDQLSRRPQFRYALLTAWQADELPSALRHDNLAVITRPYHRSTPRNIAVQMVVMARLMRRLGAALEFNCNPLGCFRPGWPRVITVHDLYFDILRDQYRLRHRLWWKLFFPLVLSSSAAAVCVSNATRNDLARFHPGGRAKAVVIHEAGALIDQANPDPTSGDVRRPDLLLPYGLYVGNISPNKNPGALIAALKILEQRGQPLRVYHVGRDELQLLANAAGAADLRVPVTTLAGLSDAALADAYRGATCVIVTSTYEGFCLPVIEAQTLRVPVVCSDIPVLREVAGEAALFFDPSDPNALVDRLDLISQDAELRGRLAQAGQQNAARFSWSRAAAEAEALFAQIIESQAAI
jgi:glycosyltransferase involved in cell wall biosynthesis